MFQCGLLALENPGVNAISLTADSDPLWINKGEFSVKLKCEAVTFPS